MLIKLKVFETNNKCPTLGVNLVTFSHREREPPLGNLSLITFINESEEYFSFTSQ